MNPLVPCSATNEMVNRFPPPWDLRGTGYVFLYRFPKRLRGARFFSPEFLPNQPFRGFGTVMLLHYEQCAAGPYWELLFCPGKFTYRGKKLYSITKIYVSTMASLVNGRENWGIPKELADFRVNRLDTGRESIVVAKGDDRVLEVTLRARGPSFRANTSLFPLRLVHRYAGRTFLTRFSAKGRGRFARMESLLVNDALFPNVSQTRPLFIIKLEDFATTFPEPEIFEDG